jgi:hypothetical protein
MGNYSRVYNEVDESGILHYKGIVIVPAGSVRAMATGYLHNRISIDMTHCQKQVSRLIVPPGGFEEV